MVTDLQPFQNRRKSWEITNIHRFVLLNQWDLVGFWSKSMIFIDFAMISQPPKFNYDFFWDFFSLSWSAILSSVFWLCNLHLFSKSRWYFSGKFKFYFFNFSWATVTSLPQKLSKNESIVDYWHNIVQSTGFVQFLRETCDKGSWKILKMKFGFSRKVSSGFGK